MKNIHYNLVKLLHLELDNLWRIEKFYLENSKSESCACSETLEKIAEDSRAHIEALKKELGAHYNSDQLD